MVMMFMRDICVQLLCVVASVSLLVGCRATSAPDAGFISDPQDLAPNSMMPFDDVWFKQGVDLASFNSVYIAPIDTSHLLKLDWWDTWNLAPGDEQQQAKRLAEYFSQKLAEAFGAYENKKLPVVSAPLKDSLIVELAIVEVIPTKIWLNAIGYVGLGPLSYGTTAFEGRLRDGASQAVIAEFKDRELGQVDVVSVADFAWFRHAQHTIEVWSDDIVKICFRAPNESISPMSTVTLRPW